MNRLLKIETYKRTFDHISYHFVSDGLEKVAWAVHVSQEKHPRKNWVQKQSVYGRYGGWTFCYQSLLWLGVTLDLTLYMPRENGECANLTYEVESSDVLWFSLQAFIPWATQWRICSSKYRHSFRGSQSRHRRKFNKQHADASAALSQTLSPTVHIVCIR